MRLFNNYLLTMMKKIKSIQQLRAEKKRLKQEVEERENTIRVNWLQLKETLKPANMAKGALSKVLNDKTADNMNGESVLKNTFTYGVSLLAKKIADKAGEKFDKLFKKKNNQ